MKEIKIICVCGFGIGSSLLLKMKVDEMLNDNGISLAVEPSDITTAKSKPSDLIFTSRELASQLIDAVKCPVIVVDNFMDKKEIEEKGLKTITELMEEI